MLTQHNYYLGLFFAKPDALITEAIEKISDCQRAILKEQVSFFTYCGNLYPTIEKRYYTPKDYKVIIHNVKPLHESLRGEMDTILTKKKEIDLVKIRIGNVLSVIFAAGLTHVDLYHIVPDILKATIPSDHILLDHKPQSDLHIYYREKYKKDFAELIKLNLKIILTN